MLFEVERTSDWGFNPAKRPLPECKLTQLRNNDSVLERWCIEIKSIEELILLTDKVGKCIVSARYPFSDEPVAQLEIYDDYRE